MRPIYKFCNCPNHKKLVCSLNAASTNPDKVWSQSDERRFNLKAHNTKTWSLVKSRIVPFET